MATCKSTVLFLALLVTACGSGGGEESAAKDGRPAPVTFTQTVFIGDSITAGWSLLGGHRELANKGIGGQTSQQMLARFASDVVALHPVQVHILAGTNDVIQHGSTDVSAVESMAALAVAANIVPILATIPPMDIVYSSTLVETWNANITALATTQGYKLVDYHGAMILPGGAQNAALFVDGVHPNEAGYEIMVRLVSVML